MEKKKLTPLLMCLIPTLAGAQLQFDGRQIGREVANLITYAKMPELGMADPDCKGVLFFSHDIDLLITHTLTPIVEVLTQKEGKSSAEGKKVIATFRKELNSPTAVKTREVVYRRMKAEAIQAYGNKHHCVALSMGMATIVKQKQLLFESLMTSN